MSQNYTSIDYLLKKQAGPSSFSNAYTKETEPMVKKREAIGHEVKQKEIHEVVENIISKEVSPHVIARKETIDVSDDLKKMGVHSAPPIKFPAYRRIILPISDELVMRGLKAPIFSSMRWLSELCLYLLKQAHISLKTIHGKARRVLVR